MRTVVQIGEDRFPVLEDNGNEEFYREYDGFGWLIYQSHHFTIGRGIKAVATWRAGEGVTLPHCGRCFHTLYTSGHIEYVNCGVHIEDQCHCMCHDPSNYDEDPINA